MEDSDNICENVLAELEQDLLHGQVVAGEDEVLHVRGRGQCTEAPSTYNTKIHMHRDVLRDRCQNFSRGGGKNFELEGKIWGYSSFIYRRPTY